MCAVKYGLINTLTSIIVQAGHHIVQKTVSEEESRSAVAQYFLDNKGAQAAALTYVYTLQHICCSLKFISVSCSRLRQNFRSALHGPISKLLEEEFEKRGIVPLEKSPVERVQEVESW